MTDADPIPTGELPKGWVSAGPGLRFEHPTTGLAVCADRRTGDAEAEMAGEPCAWRIRYERQVGETVERQNVGAVTTRDAAVDGLLACMRRVSDGSTPVSDGGGTAGERVPEDCRWTALSTLAADVSLRGAVPTATKGELDEASYARSWAERLDAAE